MHSRCCCRRRRRRRFPAVHPSSEMRFERCRGPEARDLAVVFLGDEVLLHDEGDPLDAELAGARLHEVVQVAPEVQDAVLQGEDRELRGAKASEVRV